ncbi:MAG: hypothetical protein EOO92_12110 [Pedobacter sp.]|nr:MAG: hypothetical protein EOO92_12110 [Pedobacter sp.]
MSFLNALINEVSDEEVQERFQDRVAIIQHKIKFMDKVSVVFLNSDNVVIKDMENLIAEAGGILQESPTAARVLIYTEPGVGMLQLMGMVPTLLDAQWPAVEYDRVYLWDDQSAVAETPENAVDALEDLAEMLYPGYFVFGNEGNNWMSFKTK